jgi:hypothetical protein
MGASAHRSQMEARDLPSNHFSMGITHIVLLKFKQDVDTNT